MDTLLLQLVAPMQSWGVQSIHGDRDTGLEPSKSGVIGLICAALGRDRSEDVADLAALKMGVRVDREGKLSYDFHKAEPLDAQGSMKAGGKVTIGDRHYLADAAFLVALEGDPQTLRAAQHALMHPVYTLCLGRKAFPPARPIWLADGQRQGSRLLDALLSYPPIASEASARRRVMIEDPRGEMTVHDQPLSFAERRFAPRRVHVAYYDFPEVTPCSSPN